MGRLSAVLLALLLGGASAVALVSCGGGSNADLLPGTTASEIESNLDQVRQLTAEGDCIGAEDAVANVTAEVEELQGVDRKLQAALQEGTTKLSEVISECEETAETEPSVEPDVEAEELEEEKKPKKEKPDKEPAEAKEEATEPEEGPELPPQSNGKGEEKGKGGPPAPEPEETAPSGGVGPGVEVEE
ncbi:MAG: hypothetical protein ACTHK3_08020 [Solirubrobacterales bacterium]